MSKASKLKPKSKAQEVAETARNLATSRTSRGEEAISEEQSIQFKDIHLSNEFAKVMLAPDLSPEGKRDALVKALTFSKESTKEENRAKLRQFEQFKEYLQEQRKVLNRAGIKLQDTQAFAELQTVIDDMTKASIEFQETVKPLLDVLNAVFEIRKQDRVTDIYKEIQDDKIWQEEQEAIIKTLEDDLSRAGFELDKLQREKAMLVEDRSLFGFGSTKASARQRIAEIDQVDEVRTRETIEQIAQKIEEHKQILEAGPHSYSPELREQKAVLKEFLDLSKDENVHRQKALIDAAVNYVDTSDRRLKSVIKTLDGLSKHAEIVSDANSMLRNVHLIMDESLKEVSGINNQVKNELNSSQEGESSIARMTREEKLKEVHEYMSLTDDSAIDIANSIGELTKHSVQIQAYKDTLRNESGSTKRLHLEGVSQMGEQLMSVISAISSAATSESRALAANNFSKMAEQNQAIISQEVVKNASNIEIEANNIAKLVGELEDYGAVLNASNEIANQGYGRMRETVDAIRKVSASVQDSIGEFIADRADASIAGGINSEITDGSNGKEQKESKTEPEQTFANPFDQLKNNY